MGLGVPQLQLAILIIQRDSEEQNLGPELENKPKSMEKQGAPAPEWECLCSEVLLRAEFLLCTRGDSKRKSSSGTWYSVPG